MAGGRLWTSKAHGVRKWDSWDCWDIWVHATNHYWSSSTLKFSNTEVQSSNVKFPWSLESDFIVGLVCAGTCHQSKCCPPFRWFYIMYLRSRLFLVVQFLLRVSLISHVCPCMISNGYISPWSVRYALYGEISPKVDVFSFGVVLYELISGRGAILQGDLSTSSPQSGSSQGRTLTSLVCFFILPILLLSDENVSDRQGL